MNYPVSGKGKVTIEQMTETEAEVAIGWAQREGWNPGIHDAACFYHTDPNGFFVAKLGDEIVGTISLVKYASDFCFEGLYIVKPEFRGRGIGRQIQDFALDTCRNSNLGLDGVVSMQKRYEKYGFRIAYENTRYEGIAKAEPKGTCLPIKPQDFDEIVAYDREIFTLDRKQLLKSWLFQKDASIFMIKDTVGKISGYGVIRKCIKGHKIGPLFADDAATAVTLFDGLVATVIGETIFLDVPQPNAMAVALAQKKAMQPVFSTVRMYSKFEPKVPLNKVFGVTSFELG